MLTSKSVKVKDIIRKENYTIIFLINIDPKILNKILASHIQQHKKRRKKKGVYTMTKQFIPGMQGWFNI